MVQNLMGNVTGNLALKGLVGKNIFFAFFEGSEVNPLIDGGCADGSVVEHRLRVPWVPGSIPGGSIEKMFWQAPDVFCGSEVSAGGWAGEPVEKMADVHKARPHP